ncbi:MAG: hypothetical protein CMF62_12975 [Magnetococcales bacterium]|nr:hypothetical protein [Magnetococcales bacterium]|tara:strand:+ start:66311 stop:66607 length:297 start_codon:yes stop_codon:yes gene_type:complete
MIEPKTLSIVQTGNQLRIHGSVITLIDGFELDSVKLGKVANGTAIVLAQVNKRDRVNIFSSGEIKFDVTFEVPEKLTHVQIVVNAQFDATLEVTHNPE